MKESHRRHLKALTGLSGGVSRSIATHPRAYTGDQLYDLKLDPDAQKNLVGYPRHDRILRKLKQTLAAELKKFPDRPYGNLFRVGTQLRGVDMMKCLKHFVRQLE